MPFDSRHSEIEPKVFQAREAATLALSSNSFRQSSKSMVRAHCDCNALCPPPCPLLLHQAQRTIDFDSDAHSHAHVRRHHAMDVTCTVHVRNIQESLCCTSDQEQAKSTSIAPAAATDRSRQRFPIHGQAVAQRELRSSMTTVEDAMTVTCDWRP